MPETPEDRDATLESILDLVEREIPRRLNRHPSAPGVYLAEFFDIVRELLKPLLEDAEGAISPQGIAILAQLKRGQDPALDAVLEDIIRDEADNPPSNLEKKHKIIANRLVREYAQQRKNEFDRIVAEVRAAATKRNTPPQIALRETAAAGDPLVADLERYLKNPGLRMLRGYLGTSDNPGYRRLYASLDLMEFLDIKSEDIVRTVDLRTRTNPLGGAVVWVKSGSRLIRGQSANSVIDLQGRFLGGGSSGGGWGGGRANDWTPNDWTPNDWTPNDWTPNDWTPKGG